MPEFHLLQLSEGTQPHVENGLGLPIGEVELRHHDRLRLVLGTDNLDDPVEIEVGDDIAFDELQPASDLVQPMSAAALQNVDLAGGPVP